MAKQYYSVLTNYGTQVIAGAIASKQPLQITQMAVGDGNGQATTPNSRNTGLVREVHRADISAISVDPCNDKQIIFELTIPENVGGFWIREMGIFDNQNRLVAYANCPDSFKPELTSGSGKVQVVRMILLVSSSDAITLKVDDSVIFATRGQLTPKTITATSQNAVDESGHSHEIDKASTSQAGIVELDSSINSKAENKAATPKAVKTAYDKAVDGVNKANAAQTAANNAQATANAAIPSSKKSDSVISASSDTVATSKAVKTAYDKAVDGVNNANAAQMAANNAQTTADAAIPSSKKSDSVTSASSETVATSKAVKDAYDKAVDANNNANNRVAKTGDTVTGTLYLKQGSKKYKINDWYWGVLLEIDSNLDALIGSSQCVIGFNNNGSLGLGGNAVDGWWAFINKSGLGVAKDITEGLTGKKLSESLPIPWLVGVPLPWMQSAVPAGFLAMQGQAFDKSRYSILAQRYPSGRLPDLRGEFIRGWDNGRGVDSGRSLLSNQGDAIRDITGSINNITSEGSIGASGVFSSSYSSGGGRAAGDGAGSSTAYFDVSRVVPTASENRPRNIAYQYICLAA